MLTCKIQLEGKTSDELIYALDEVKRLLNNEFTSGMYKCSDGGYDFSVEGEEELEKEDVESKNSKQ